jgi:hypothetical protein
MWVLVSIGVGLVSIAAVLIAYLVTRWKGSETLQPAAELSSNQWYSLGITFTGAGAALTATLGPVMIWMIGVGVIYMGMGARTKRTGSH